MIITPERSWLFRAMAKADMQEWLFAFHRSLAVIVARLVDGGGNGSSNGGGGHGGLQTPSPGLGGFHRYGMGAGGLLSSRNDTNLMASRRGGLRAHAVAEERGEMGHGHGRSLSGAPHRVRQVRGARVLVLFGLVYGGLPDVSSPSPTPFHTHTPQAPGGALLVEPGIGIGGTTTAAAAGTTTTHGGILRGISPPTRRTAAGLLRRGVVSSADTWGSAGNSPMATGVGLGAGAGGGGGVSQHFSTPSSPPAGAGARGGAGGGGLMGGLLLRGSPPPPLAHAGAPQLYSTTTPADYLMLSSRAMTASSSASASSAMQQQGGGGGGERGGLQQQQVGATSGGGFDVSAEVEAQALVALAADAAAAARYASPASTGTGASFSFRRGDSASSLPGVAAAAVVSAAYTGEQTHQHAAQAVALPHSPEAGAGAGRGGLSLDLGGWARRARVGPAAVVGGGQTPTPSTGGSGGDYGGPVVASPMGSLNGQAVPPQQQGAVVGRVGSLASSLGGEVGGVGSPYHHGQSGGGLGAGEEAPGLMFEMSMDEVLDEGVGGLRLSSPRPPSTVGGLSGGVGGGGGEGERVLGTTYTQTLYPPLVEAAGGGLINVRVEEGHYHHHHHHNHHHQEVGAEGGWDDEAAEAATERLSVSPAAGGRAGRRRPRPVGELVEERRELGWSFGVISLQGIRKNQEDQVCV